MPFSDDDAVPSDAVDLTVAIDAVFEQLTAAILNLRENDVLGFEYEDVEIELQMTATKNVGGQAESNSTSSRLEGT